MHIRQGFEPRFARFKILVAMAVVLVMAACQGGDRGRSAEVLVIGNGTEPATLDLHQATGQPELRILGALVEGLVVRTPNAGTVEPGLAKSWSVDSSGTRYDFQLRKARWSDGSALTAHSVVASWKRFADPATAAEYASLLRVVRNGDSVRLGRLPMDSLGIQATSDSTLTVRLESPVAFFLDLCAFEPFAPVPVDSIERHGKAWTQIGRFVGNGPFRLAERSRNQSLILERNPFYWDSNQVSLRRIEVRPIEDQLTAFQMFRNFELDWTFNIPPSRMQNARRMPEFYVAPMYGTYYFLVNCRKPGFESPLLRQALSYAIDRQRLVDKVLKGIGSVATGFVPATAPYPELQVLAFDTAKARDYLRRSGFSAENPPPGLQILFNNSETHKTIAEVIQQMWKSTLGLNAELVNYEWKVYLENTRNLHYSGLARASWIGDFSDPISFLELFTTNNGNNRAGYSNAAYDSLIALSWKEADATKRLGLLHQAEALLLKEMPIIPVYHYAVTEMRSPRLRHADPNPLGMYAWKNLSLDALP